MSMQLLVWLALFCLKDVTSYQDSDSDGPTSERYWYDSDDYCQFEFDPSGKMVSLPVCHSYCWNHHRVRAIGMCRDLCYCISVTRPGGTRTVELPSLPPPDHPITNYYGLNIVNNTDPDMWLRRATSTA